MRPSIRSAGVVRSACLFVGAAVAAATLLAAPAAAEPVAQPAMKCVEQDPYFFHGTSGQQGGFSTDAPSNPAPAAQLALKQPGPLQQPASWADSFHGDLCGQATVTVHLAPLPQWTNPPPDVSTSTSWRVAVITDGDRTIADRVFEQDALTPQETTVTFRSKATVAEKLMFRVGAEPFGGGAVLYDSPEFAAGFTVSTLQPCEVHDPHPDCVAAGFADLADDVRAFASTGEVSADGETQLLAALDQAQAAYDHGVGDNAQAIASLEDFQQLAADPALVPSDPARDTLIAAASDLIAALEDG